MRKHVSICYHEFRALLRWRWLMYSPRVVWTMGQSDFWSCSLSCCSVSSLSLFQVSSTQCVKKYFRTFSLQCCLRMVRVWPLCPVSVRSWKKSSRFTPSKLCIILVESEKWLNRRILRLSHFSLSRLISSESSFVFDSLKLYSSSHIPLIILVILLWTPSRLSMSFWLCGRHACTQYSKCGLTRLLYKAMMFLFDLFSYVRLISPTNLFALLTHVAMWWLGLSDWLITTPRSFSSVECAIFCAPIVYSCFGFAWPKCTHLHFPGLNSICHSPAQWNALARSAVVRWFVPVCLLVPLV